MVYAYFLVKGDVKFMGDTIFTSIAIIMFLIILFVVFKIVKNKK